MTKTRLRRVAVIIAVNLGISAILGELILRAFLPDVDLWLLRPLLYYQTGDTPVHQATADAEQLYELKPGVTLETRRKSGAPRHVSINSLGFRDREREARKPPGVFRIVILGSSNTYGADVDNDETYPAQLERLLNERGGPTRFEVWNAGISAYVPSQIMEHARHVLRDFDPDLLIVQMYIPGRRAFAAPVSSQTPWEGIPYPVFRDYFTRNPDLYWENLPFLDPTRLTRWIFVHSALYRALAIGVNRLHLPRINPDFDGDGANDRAVAAFARDFMGKVKVFTIGMNPSQTGGPSSGYLPRLFREPVKAPSADPQFQEVHPPPYVYRWVAEALRDELVARQLIPLRADMLGGLR